MPFFFLVTKWNTGQSLEVNTHRKAQTQTDIHLVTWTYMYKHTFDKVDIILFFFFFYLIHLP